MDYPHIMLGGVPIVLEAGAPVSSEEPLGGANIVRLSTGTGVPVTHWERMAGSISGQGFMPPGLEGLDYSLPLELRSRQVTSINGTGLTYTLHTPARPDVTPWALALVAGEWASTPCSVVGKVVTVTPVAGAQLYSVCWFPLYTVIARRPARGQDDGTASHSWTITWEQV